ncbi:MAG: hypothetical protein WAX89_06295 [Alphaproteobacteria bacterium]
MSTILPPRFYHAVGRIFLVLCLLVGFALGAAAVYLGVSWQEALTGSIIGLLFALGCLLHRTMPALAYAKLVAAFSFGVPLGHAAIRHLHTLL